MAKGGTKVAPKVLSSAALGRMVAGMPYTPTLDEAIGLESVRLDDDAMRLLREVAGLEGESENIVLGRAVRAYLEKRGGVQDGALHKLPRRHRF